MRAHREIFTREQLKLLPLVKSFHKDFILVGGTSIALHLGHRQSIDFDLFSLADFDNEKLKRKMVRYGKIQRTYINLDGEYTIMLNGVKITFFRFPYTIKATNRFEDIARLPNLLTLAAMKVLALGRRSKWKDYVDLYFILKDHYTLDEISKKAESLFGNEFNGRIFREALGYFDDIDYSEEVVFMPSFEVKDDVIKKELTKISIQ